MRNANKGLIGLLCGTIGFASCATQIRKNNNANDSGMYNSNCEENCALTEEEREILEDARRAIIASGGHDYSGYNKILTQTVAQDNLGKIKEITEYNGYFDNQILRMACRIAKETDNADMHELLIQESITHDDEDACRIGFDYVW